jgi:hypothetical protein
MGERKAISKKIRFEIFKRDKFTCQYCGRSAPEIILQVDHITPVAKDGDDDITNLITSCFDCNMGKSDRELSDDAVIQKRKKQLDELQERREQLEMMVEWNKALLNLDKIEIDGLCDVWHELSGYYLTDSGISNIKKNARRFGYQEIVESMKVSANQYLHDNKGAVTQETVNKAFDYIVRIAAVRERVAKKPYMGDLYYIRGILNNRGFYLGYECMDYLEKAYKLGIEIDYLKEIAHKARNWTDWRETMEQAIVFAQGKDNG